MSQRLKQTGSHSALSADTKERERRNYLAKIKHHLYYLPRAHRALESLKKGLTRMYPYQPPPPQIIVYQPEKSAGVAIVLEVVPGIFLQTFGIGHLYAGNTGLGLFFMFGYWAVTVVNFLLCFIFIGFITWPLCWIFMMIMSPILASTSVNSANAAAQPVYPVPPMYR